jgi:hypothetical protein
VDQKKRCARGVCVRTSPRDKPDNLTPLSTSHSLPIAARLANTQARRGHWSDDISRRREALGGSAVAILRAQCVDAETAWIKRVVDRRAEERGAGGTPRLRVLPRGDVMVLSVDTEGECSLQPRKAKCNGA